MGGSVDQVLVVVIEALQGEEVVQVGGSVDQVLVVVMGPCKGRRLYRWVVVWTRC